MGETDKREAECLNVFGVEVRILLECEDAADGHAVTELVCGPGEGAPLHRHREREAFYVLSGTVRMVVNGREQILVRGDFIQVEAWQVHTFFNAGREAARMVNLSTPAGHARFFRDADALYRSGQFTPERARAVSAANGIEIVPEPVGQ